MPSAFDTNADGLKSKMSNSPSSDEVSIEDDQSDGDSASSGDEMDDETAESDLRPYIFSSDGQLGSCYLHSTSPIILNLLLCAGTRRSFVVQQIIRANSSHRPSFTFVGYAVEYAGARGSQTDRGNSAGNMSARQHRPGSQTARGGQSQRARLVVIAGGLTLNITYEPPSPKFHQQCPDSSSYRLKLFKGDDFLYSVRGLPQLVKVHPNAYIVRWGPLELQYSSRQQLDTFTTSVKHVELKYVDCGQHTARQSAVAVRSPATLTPLETSSQPQPSQRSSFGSPLPEQQSDTEAGVHKEFVQAGDVRMDAVKASKDSTTRNKQSSFLTDNWVWVGLGIAAVAVVTYTVFSTDSTITRASKPSNARQYKLHVI